MIDRRNLFLTLAVLAAGLAPAAESGPLPVPTGDARARAVRLYDDGVALVLVLVREFSEA